MAERQVAYEPQHVNDSFFCRPSLSETSHRVLGKFATVRVVAPPGYDGRTRIARKRQLDFYTRPIPRTTRFGCTGTSTACARRRSPLLPRRLCMPACTAADVLSARRQLRLTRHFGSHSMSIPPHERPPPKLTRATGPFILCTLFHHSVSASGTLAAAVFPYRFT